MKRILAAALCISVSACVSASDIGDRLKPFLPETLVGDLVSKGSIQNSAYREQGATPKLAPSTPLAQEALGGWIGTEAPFFVETLSLYKKPAELQGSAGCDRAKVSILLRSISRLQGIEYYSHSRKKMRTLYDKSYVVDDVTSKNRIADPISGSANMLSLIALQKDLTFGEYLYAYDYRETEDSVAFYSSNINAMYYTVIKVLDPNSLRISLVIQDLGDYFLIYSLTRARFVAIPGLEDKVNNSFSARASAVYDWFLKEYEKH